MEVSFKQEENKLEILKEKLKDLEIDIADTIENHNRDITIRNNKISRLMNIKY